MLVHASVVQGSGRVQAEGEATGDASVGVAVVHCKRKLLLYRKYCGAVLGVMTGGTVV